jgi:hypothetical protein
MKKMYLAAAIAMFSTVLSAEEMYCDLVDEGGKHVPIRLIRSGTQAVLLLDPDTVNAQSGRMWCGGSSCVNLDMFGDVEAGQMLLIGPTLHFDVEGNVLGEPIYEYWNRGFDNPIELRCAE